MNDVERSRWQPAPEMVWPNGARCAVWVSFDVDGPSVWIDGDLEALARPALFSLGAYGPERGVANLLSLLRGHGITATFFVPGWIAEQWPDCVTDVAEGGHELGHHGYLHELYYDLSLEEQEEIIAKSQAIFQKVAGIEAVGYRSPSGDFSEGTPGLLDRLGFSYSSSMRGGDLPYRWTVEGRVTDLVEIPSKWELDDFPQFGYHDDPVTPSGQDRLSPLRATFDNWRREFDGHYRFGLCYVLMLHPQLIGKPARVKLLGELLDHIGGHDVWFATGREIADWYRSTVAPPGGAGR